MKKIKLTVASILLSGICFAQSGGHDFYREKVIIERTDHIELINTIEDTIEWMTADIKSGDVKPCIGEGYLENLRELLFVVKNRTILIECENCDEID